jgi:signal transduction histidine kinase
VAALEKTKLFSGMLAEELQALEQTAQIRSFKSGQTIFTEGDPGDGLYVMIEGVVQISAFVNQQERRVLSRVGAGDFFGEMAVLDSEPRSATAIADKDTKVYFISRDDLLSILEHSPQLAIGLVRQISLRMREVNRNYIQEVLQAERLTLVGRFARSIVHDFKNPLNIIGLAGELASMEKATPEMRATAQKRIQRQVTRLSNMINELLEFTRGTQSNIVLGQADFAGFVRPLLEEIQPEIAEKSVTLACVNDPPSIGVLIDPKRLPHVFYNLIQNAAHAMPSGGKVLFRFSVNDKEMVTEVEDTGKGIAPEIANRLFEPFATYGKAQGTGLGLSICKKIIEDHRGKISAHSEPGRGAIFTFTLPLAK